MNTATAKQPLFSETSEAFGQELSRWLRDVADSGQVNNVLKCGLLIRAIQQHAAQYIADNVGMRLDDAEMHLRAIAAGEFDADEGDPIYEVLGIDEPSK